MGMMGRASLLIVVFLLLQPLARAGASPTSPNPCETPEAAHLLCPDLRIGAPAEIYVQRVGGRLLLRATSNVKSRGRGPIELHGIRNGRRSMRVNQRIYRAGGGHIDLRTRASLRFTDVGS